MHNASLTPTLGGGTLRYTFVQKYLKTTVELE